jgi:hypothetical protein
VLSEYHNCEIVKITDILEELAPPPPPSSRSGIIPRKTPKIAAALLGLTILVS